MVLQELSSSHHHRHRRRHTTNMDDASNRSQRSRQSGHLRVRSLHKREGFSPADDGQERFAKLCYQLVRHVQSGSTDSVVADLSNFRHLKDSEAATFGSVLKYCRNLVRTLIIDVNSFDIPDGDGMASVVHFVRRSHVLMSLSIYGSGGSNKGDESSAAKVKMVAALLEAAAANKAGQLSFISLDSVTLPVTTLAMVLSGESRNLDVLSLHNVAWIARSPPTGCLTNLLTAFQTCRLSSLDISGGSPQGLASILRANPRLASLVVTVVDENVAEAVKEFLRGTKTLMSLDLGKSTVNAPLGKRLLEGLDGNESVQELNIAKCRVEDIWDSLFLWAKPLLKKLTVKVTNHDIATTCCQMLEARNCHLESLKVVDIDEDLAQVLLPGLAKNRTIKELHLFFDSSSLPIELWDGKGEDWHTVLTNKILSRAPFLQSFESNHFDSARQLCALRNRCLRLLRDCSSGPQEKKGQEGPPVGLWAHVWSTCLTAGDCPPHGNLGPSLLMFLCQSSPNTILAMTSSVAESGSSRSVRQPRRLCAV